MRHQQRIEGVATPRQALEQYVHVPFTVPPGARRLEVSYYFENQVTGAQEVSSGNNIDIGVFDTRGAEFLGGGFRGWSGGARSSFSIERERATPGYLRGPIQPGEWTMLLGCSKIDDPAVRYRLNIDVDIDPLAAAEAVGDVPVPGGDAFRSVAGASGAQPPAAGGRWYRGDLHAHSEHSDGKNTVEEIVRYTQGIGLDYFALTDHNTISHWDELARLNTGAPLLIPGEEITMYGGHANVWGLDDWIDFRGTDAERVQRLVEQANARGSMFSINHPDSPIPWLHPQVRGYQAVEVWNAPWRWFNEPALERWAGHLRRGERMVAVGGSDSHCVPPAKMTQPNGPGEPCTWAYVEGALTQAAVLDAVSRGRVFISEAPNGPFLELRAERAGEGDALTGDLVPLPEDGQLRLRVRYRGPDGKHIRLFGREGFVAEFTAESEDEDRLLEIAAEGDGFVRAEVRGFRGRPERGEVVHALTNPIFWGSW